MTAKNEKITFRVSPVLKFDLQEKADLNNMKLSAYILQILEEKLAEAKIKATNRRQRNFTDQKIKGLNEEKSESFILAIVAMVLILLVYAGSKILNKSIAN